MLSLKIRLDYAMRREALTAEQLPWILKSKVICALRREALTADQLLRVTQKISLTRIAS